MITNRKTNHCNIMNDALSHNLGFKTDDELNIFKDLLALICNLDEPLMQTTLPNETSIIGATLITRLFLLLCFDNTYVYEKQRAANVDEKINGTSSALSGGISHTQSKTVIDIKEENKSGADKVYEASFDDDKPRLGTITGRKRIFTILPCTRNRTDALLTGIATKVAQTLYSQDTKKTASSTTVAKSICRCIDLIENVNTGKRILEPLVHIIIKGEANIKTRDSLIITAKNELQCLLTSALKAIMQDIKSSVEAIYDFEYAWEACAYRASHLSNIFGEHQMVESAAKECAWLLASIISLHRHLLTVTINPSVEGKRRARITLNAACIALIARSTAPCRSNMNVDRVYRNESSLTPKCTGYEKLEESTGSKCDEDKSNFQNKPQKQPLNLCESRLPLENDAIAALSMMITGNGSKASGEQRNFSFIRTPTASQYHHTNTIISTLIQTSNELLTFTKSNEKKSPVPISWNDLEDGIESIQKKMVKLNGKIKKMDQNESPTITLFPLTAGTLKSFHGSPTEIDLKVKQENNSSLQKKMETKAIELLAPYFCTHDALSLTKIKLRALYQRLNNASLEVDKAKDAFSYFGKCKFVDDMVMYSHSSKYVRDFLIKSYVQEVPQEASIEACSKIMIYDRLKGRLPETHNENSSNTCSSSFNSSSQQSKTISIVTEVTEDILLDRVDSNTRHIQLNQVEAIAESELSRTSQGPFQGSLTKYPKSNTIISPEDNFLDRVCNNARHIQLPQVERATESELCNWTSKLLKITMKSISPSLRLKMYLDAMCDRGSKCIEQLSTSKSWRDILIPVLNNAMCQIRLESKLRNSGRNTEVAPHNDPPVEVDINGVLPPKDIIGLKPSKSYRHTDMTHEVIGRALVGFYYESLETVLYHETARLKSACHPKLLMNTSFHKALLSLCYICLLSGIGVLSSVNDDIDKNIDGSLLNIRSVLDLMSCTAYEYLKVSAVVSCFPVFLMKILHKTEEYILDSLLWTQNDETYGNMRTLKDVIQKFTQAGEAGALYPWPLRILRSINPEERENKLCKERGLSSKFFGLDELGPEYTYVTFLMKKILAITSQRIASICVSLLIPPTYPVASQIWIAFRYLLRNKIDLLYSRHIDQLILCTIYGVCKTIKLVPDVTFSNIISKYIDLNRSRLGEKCCQRIIRNIKFHPNDFDHTSVNSKVESDTGTDEKHQATGNVIDLYNRVYIPAMKKHLLQSKSRISKEKAGLGSIRKRPIDEAAPPGILAPQHIIGTHIFVKFPTRGYEPRNKRRKESKGSSMGHKNRTVYNFGKSSGKAIALINEKVHLTVRPSKVDGKNI